MNDITRSILLSILPLEECWDKKTRKLRRDHVQHLYTGMREARWFKEIYFPKMFAEVLKMKNSGEYPDEAFEWFEWDENLSGWWLADEDLHWDLECRMEQEVFADIWYGYDWAYEEPTVEEVMSLGIRPSMVPSKEDHHGNVQLSMI